jgi:hypothetical protein
MSGAVRCRFVMECGRWHSQQSNAGDAGCRWRKFGVLHGVRTVQCPVARSCLLTAYIAACRAWHDGITPVPMHAVLYHAGASHTRSAAMWSSSVRASGSGRSRSSTSTSAWRTAAPTASAARHDPRSWPSLWGSPRTCHWCSAAGWLRGTA